MKQHLLRSLLMITLFFPVFLLFISVNVFANDLVFLAPKTPNFTIPGLTNGTSALPAVNAVDVSVTSALITAIPVSNGPSCGTYTNKTIVDGLGSNTVYDVYASGSTVYAATFYGLSISTDGGTTFTNKTMANGLGNNRVYGVFVIGSTVYAATMNGLSISTNGGNSFTNYQTGLVNNRVNDVYAIGSTVYVATNLNTGGLSISTNGGTNFTNYTTANGLGSNGVNGVYAIGSTVYAATDGGLSISTNGGTSFTNYTTTNGLGINIVNQVFAIGSTVYAATDRGLSISTNGGTTFTNYTTANGLGSDNVYGVYAIGSTVYAATFDGLSISIDGGTSFTNYKYTTLNGYGDNIVNQVFAIGSKVYAATYNGGLSSCTQPPSAPTSLSATAGDRQVQISFTAGADGGSPITNYEYTINGGTTWTQLNPADGTSPVTIPGLTNGTSYTLALRAVNAVGVSVGSGSVTASLLPSQTSLLSGILTIAFQSQNSTTENIAVNNDGTNITLTGIVAGETVFPLASVNKIIVLDSGGGTAQTLTFSGSAFALSGGLLVTGVETATINAIINTSTGVGAIAVTANTILIGANMTTNNGNQTYTGNVVVDYYSLILTSVNGNIVINGTINSKAGLRYPLTINTPGGDISLTDAIGTGYGPTEAAGKELGRLDLTGNDISLARVGSTLSWPIIYGVQSLAVNALDASSDQGSILLTGTAYRGKDELFFNSNGGDRNIIMSNSADFQTESAGIVGNIVINGIWQIGVHNHFIISNANFLFNDAFSNASAIVGNGGSITIYSETATINAPIGQGSVVNNLTVNSGANFIREVKANNLSISTPPNDANIVFSGDLEVSNSFTTGNTNTNITFLGATTIQGNTSFLNRGTLTLGNAGTDLFNFKGGVTASNPSLINLIGTVAAEGTGVINLNAPLLIKNGNALVGGISTGAITLGNSIIENGATLTVGTGINNAVNLAAIAGTAGGSASNLTINTLGTASVTGTVGTDIGNLRITNSGGTTFQNTVEAATGIITNTTGTIDFERNLTLSAGLTTAVQGYNIKITGSNNTIAGASTFINTGTLLLGNNDTDVVTFSGGHWNHNQHDRHYRC